jgi:hypothetical protein
MSQLSQPAVTAVTRALRGRVALPKASQPVYLQALRSAADIALPVLLEDKNPLVSVNQKCEKSCMLNGGMNLDATLQECRIFSHHYNGVFQTFSATLISSKHSTSGEQESKSQQLGIGLGADTPAAGMLDMTRSFGQKKGRPLH